MTEDELGRKLAATNAALEAAIEAGNRDEALRLQGVATLIEELLRLRRDEPLPVSDHRGSNDPMLSTARRHVSRGRRAKGDRFAEALDARGFTLRSLADAVGVSHVLLSQARRGERSIGLDVARRIEELTGVPATRATWPKLRD